MLHSIFTIFDSKASAYLQPFFSINTATAIRAITQALADPQHNFTKNAEDYHLCSLGTFDDFTAEIIPFSKPTPLGCLSSFFIKQ
jgi:hypothetical protein